MLEREVIDDGWQVRLPVTGAALKFRLIPAAFLSVWLCGWGVGEFVVGGKLLGSLQAIAPSGSWIASLPAASGGGAPATAFVLGFLTLWLAMWTAGGVVAMASVLGLVLGTPVVRVSATTLEFAVQLGSFCRGRSIPLAGITGIAQGPLGTLAVSGAHGQLSVGPFADDSDRSQLTEWLTEARRQAGASDEVAKAA